jgi:hypothetical protein
MTLLLLLHAYNCKDLHRSLRRIQYRDNPALMGAVALGVVTLVPTFYFRVLYEKVFYQAPLTWEWALVAGACFIFLAAAEAYKAWVRPRVMAWERGEVAQRKAARSRLVSSAGLELVVVAGGSGSEAASEAPMVAAISEASSENGEERVGGLAMAVGGQ